VPEDFTAEDIQVLRQDALALQRLGRFDEALELLNKLVSLVPEDAGSYYLRGNLLSAMNRLKSALESYNTALTLNPADADALKNRGTILLRLWRLEEAVASFNSAIALRPDYAEAFNNRGSALHHLGRLSESIASFNQAIALKPRFLNAIVNRGMARLLEGNFEEGWVDYEHRWLLRGIPGKRSSEGELWTGQELAGRTIAVYAKGQGLGDVIQFARYLPLLVHRGAKVTLELPERLERVLEPVLSDVEVVASIEGKGPFDFHCAIMSLPFGFRTALSSIPAGGSYLKSSSEDVAKWRGKLGVHGFKIGVAWHADPTQDWGRTVPLRYFEPLARVPGVRLISLQKNYGIEQLASLPPGMQVESLGEAFDSGPDAFMDSVAVMMNLDLIICADVSISHVAGALERPTWVALKHVPDWRWLLDREDCPWYPTMRLFRQPSDGDWVSVFSHMTDQLRALRGPD